MYGKKRYKGGAIARRGAAAAAVQRAAVSGARQHALLQTRR